MPAPIAFRRSKPSVVADDIFPAEEPATATGSHPSAVVFALRAVLRIGDYEVGETYCPRLCGHPGIRY